MNALAWLIPMVVCPSCRQPLRFVADDEENGILEHESNSGCADVYPVIAGTPRILRARERGEVVRRHRSWFESTPARRKIAESWARGQRSDPVVAGFDDEWSIFRTVGSTEQKELFARYFDLVPPRLFSPANLVLDAGCGAGRWAVEVGALGPRVVAVDLGASIDVARQNTDRERIACLQADILEMPLAAGVVDWAYTLGVLHHLADPATALWRVVETIRPTGMLLVYLYYALDDRGPLFRSVFRVVNLARFVTSRLPRSVLRPLADAVAVGVYWPLARTARVLSSIGARSLARSLPLSTYADRSLVIMRNDSLDRFGTRIEQRFTREELRAVLGSAGLDNVRISDESPYWHAVGERRR